MTLDRRSLLQALGALALMGPLARLFREVEERETVTVIEYWIPPLVVDRKAPTALEFAMNRWAKDQGIIQPDGHISVRPHHHLPEL